VGCRLPLGAAGRVASGSLPAQYNCTAYSPPNIGKVSEGRGGQSPLHGEVSEGRGGQCPPQGGVSEGRGGQCPPHGEVSEGRGNSTLHSSFFNHHSSLLFNYSHHLLSKDFIGA